MDLLEREITSAYEHASEEKSKSSSHKIILLPLILFLHSILLL